MLNEFIKEQCGWREIRRNEEVEYTLLFPKNEPLRFKKSYRKAKMIMAGKNFDQFDNHEAIVHASLFLPFIVIFITQIYVPIVQSEYEVNMLKFVLFLVSFFSFAWIVKCIFDVRFNSKYKIMRFSAMLMIFLYASFFSLQVKPASVSELLAIKDAIYEFFKLGNLGPTNIWSSFHKIWEILAVPVVILTLSFAYHRRMRKSLCECSENSSLVLFGIMSGMLVAAGFVVHYTAGLEYKYILPLVLYSFYFFLAYQHHRYLILIEENSAEVEALRSIVSCYIKDGDGISEPLQRSYGGRRMGF